MKEYTIYCTNKQADQALALGAPIEFQEDASHDDGKSSINPTAEQMIGWLEKEKGIVIETISSPEKFLFSQAYSNENGKINHCLCKGGFLSRKDAILAAIDAALDYLIKNKK